MEPTIPSPIDVHIYRLAKPATQSGTARTTTWCLRFLPHSPAKVDAFTGWHSSADSRDQIHLTFPSRQSAIAFATRRGWDFIVDDLPEQKIVPKSYAAKFVS